MAEQVTITTNLAARVLAWSSSIDLAVAVLDLTKQEKAKASIWEHEHKNDIDRLCINSQLLFWD